MKDTSIQSNGVGQCKDRTADSPEACQEMCAAHPDCVAFTYIGALAANVPSRKQCCFKSVLPNQENTETKQHLVTGPKTCYFEGMYTI